MAFQLTKRPYKFSYSKNPIQYAFQISNPGSPGCAMQIELYSLDIGTTLPASGLGTLIASDTLTPNPDGSVDFFCEDLLDSVLDWELPTGTGPMTVTKQICQYFIRYRQITKANPAPAWISDSGSLLIALKGGVAKEKFDRNNFFSAYLVTERPFLTWQPADHPIGETELRYLTYLHVENNQFLLTLKARAVWSDGTQETISVDLPPVATSPLFHLPVGLDQLGLATLHPTLQLWYYDVWIEDGQGLQYAAPFRLAVDHRWFYHDFSFVYHNSLGGIDTVRVCGDYDIQVVLDSVDIQMAARLTASAAGVLPTEFASINISKYEVYKGDVGQLHSRGMQESLQELLLSESVYRKVAGRWLRVVNMQKAQDLTPSDDTKYSFPLQWRYTFENVSFTPFGKDLGTGIDTGSAGPVYGICTAPAGLQVATQDLDPTLQCTFTWTAYAGAEGYELEYKLASAATWIPVPVATGQATAQVTVAVAGDYVWRVRSRCGPNDFSGYAYGSTFTYNPIVHACSAPTNFRVVLLSIDSQNAQVSFRWDPVFFGVQWVQLEWRESGTTFWQSALVANNPLNATPPSYNTTLNKDKSYECRIRSACDNTFLNWSAFVYGPVFIPANLVGSCSAPTNLGAVVQYILPGTAITQMNWTAAANASQYELQYKREQDTAWTSVPNCTSGVLIQLWPYSTTYNWRVRSQCDGGGFSQFVNGPNIAF